MSDYTDMILEGEICAVCGGALKNQYGYPVLCEDCWREEKKAGNVVRQRGPGPDSYDGKKKGFIEITKGGNQREPKNW